MYYLHRSSRIDVKNIAACQKICFPKSISILAGKNYTKKTLQWFLEGENKFLYHVTNEENKTVAFIAAFSQRFLGEGSTSGMFQFAMPQAFTAIFFRPWLLFHHEIFALYPLIFKNIRRKIFSSNKRSYNVANKKKFESRLGIVSIGVHPQHRGKGVFEILMIQFENEAKERGISNLILSVKKNNKRAVNAYKKMQWKIAAEKESTYEMSKTLLL